MHAILALRREGKRTTELRLAWATCQQSEKNKKQKPKQNMSKAANP